MTSPTVTAADMPQLIDSFNGHDVHASRELARDGSAVVLEIIHPETRKVDSTVVLGVSELDAGREAAVAAGHDALATLFGAQAARVRQAMAPRPVRSWEAPSPQTAAPALAA